MIEISENELRVDEKILKYATDDEIKEIREIAKSINNRKKCIEFSVEKKARYLHILQK